MNTSRVLLDTDTLSAIMRGEPEATAHARGYLAEHRRFSFSVITRYEILRGLLAKGATRQRQAFERLCALSELLPLTDDVARQAAEIYAELHVRGALIGDADILIGATALVHGYAVVTNNGEHFKRIAGLHVQNWLRPD
jgi:tRNA(fMet)-specific endonuclease VapC